MNEGNENLTIGCIICCGQLTNDDVIVRLAINSFIECLFLMSQFKYSDDVVSSMESVKKMLNSSGVAAVMSVCALFFCFLFF